MITDPYSPDGKDTNYKAVGSSQWDQTVFPSQKICDRIGYNYTISATPIAECFKPLWSTLEPKRSSYSINLESTEKTTGSIIIKINPVVTDINLCIVDKSSVFGLIAQVILSEF